MKVLGLAPCFLDERRFRKFRPSTIVSIYNGVMLPIFLFSSLEMRVGNSFNDNLDTVRTFAAMMENSPCVISHSCFLFSTLLFLGVVVNFLHVLLCFNISSYFTFTAFNSNFNHLKPQMSVLVPLRTSSAFLICFGFEMKNYPQFCFCVIMAVSVLSINLVAVLFVN